MKISELKQKRVLVAGLGVTGLSVARYLSRHGVAFEIADENAGDSTKLELTIRSPLHREFTAGLFTRFDVIVLSPGVPRAHPAIVAALQSGVNVIGDIELFACAVTVPVIAVTGSNGKSTVVAWLSETLKACGINAAACGNIGDPALDSLHIDVEVLVLELSSYQLESTYSLRPLCAVVLNVSDDHRDRYDNIEHYAAVKRTVFRHARHCVANHDDERTWPGKELDADCTFFTLSAPADASCRWSRSILEGVTLSVPGDHNVANALAVLALAAPLAVSQDDVLNALSAFKGLPHRSEFVAELGGVRWYNDSKGTNVDACQKAVMAMSGPVILIAGGLSKGADFSSLAGIVRQCVKLLVLIGQDRQIIADQLRDCTDMAMAETLTQAVRLAHEHACAGDAVLLSPACASFDMFRNFEDRGEQFIVAVNEVLAA